MTIAGRARFRNPVASPFPGDFMPHVLPRLAAGALLATTLFAAGAFAQTEPLPASIQSLLKDMYIEKYASLTLEDEKGAPIAPDAFAKQFKSGNGVELTKKTAGADLAVTLRLRAKDAKPVSLKAARLNRGDAFPEFKLARLDGKVVDNKALAGRYTLVSFYFATCAPCIREVPELNALAERRKDINVLAVTWDTKEDSRQFVAERQLNWPILAEAKGLIDAVGVKSYPVIALLDPQGKVVDIVISSTLSKNDGIGGWLDKRAAPPL
jgi:peroxiredoxin